MHFFPLIGGIKVLDSGFFDGWTQPRTQDSSQYPSYIGGLEPSAISRTRRSGKTWEVMALKTTLETT